MNKEIIDEFLDKNVEIKEKIEKISASYNINDFVMLSKSVRDYYKYGKKCNGDHICGCIYEVRNQYLQLDVESVKARLRNEYMDFVIDLFEKADENSFALYIVAYHYLTLCEEMAFKYIISDRAPFPYIGEEVSPLAANRLKELKKLRCCEYGEMIEYTRDEDLTYYNMVFRNLRHHHHAIKHFSLMNYLIDMKLSIDRYYFDYSFINLLDIFIFRYRVIYTEDLFVYITEERKQEIINGLVEY